MRALLVLALVSLSWGCPCHDMSPSPATGTAAALNDVDCPCHKKSPPPAAEMTLSKKHHAPERPVWPAKYKISWNFSVPYVSEYQKAGLVYQYQAFQDYGNALQTVIRDGLETVIIRVEDNAMYQIFPAQDDFKCWMDPVGSGGGPTRRLAMANEQKIAGNGIFGGGNVDSDAKPQDSLGFVIPDLSEDRWHYKGSRQYERTGVDAEVWEWDLTEGDMEMRYTFLVSQDGVPLELNMMGVNLYTGGHKDNYIATYFDFKAVEDFEEGTFEPPANVSCDEDPDPDFAARTTQGPMSVFRKVMPNKHWGHATYDAFSHRHARRHASKSDYLARLAHFTANSAFVQTWNAKSDEEERKTTTTKSARNSAPSTKRHRVALNHFADWSKLEYSRILGRRGHPKVQNSSTPQLTATLANFPIAPHFLPAEVSWKGHPADSPVKDQSACGSCYAFSSIAALEAAVCRATGKQQLLSEQEMLDCGWEAPASNTGCFGGQQDSALEWALQRGGVAAQDAYPYRGVNDFCRKESAGTRVPIKGRLVVVEGGETALMAALMFKGPLAVSVDAESDAFRFYSGGIFSEPSCSTEAADLDHAVIASGYGIDAETGAPYWLVKNMWSTYWGEEGYIRIARQPNDCGIATQPMYVEVDEN